MTAVFVPMPLPLIPFRKLVGFLLAITFHVVLIFLLLKDRVFLPVEHIGQSVVTKIVSESSVPDRVEIALLKLQAPLFNIEPPRLDIPLGKSASSQPMVVIEAKFSPGIALTIPAAQYPFTFDPLIGVYRAQVSVQIFEDGAVGDVHIESSDGNASLDNFITTYAMSHWHFEPSLSDGVPSLSWKSVRLEMTETSLSVMH